MSRSSNSTDSLVNATKSRANFSGHGSSKGAAGFRVEGDSGNGEFLSTVGESAIVNPHAHGYDKIHIGLAWDQLQVSEKQSLFDKLLGRKRNSAANVDLDLGCLYELKNGMRGCIQAFGDDMLGSYDAPPFINLSGDERTGAAEGDDEYITINGKRWPDIKRILFYAYIYDGAPDWEILKPQIHVRVPGEEPMIVIPKVARSELDLCVIAGMENVRNGIRITNYTEYYPGHAEMDRAYGFGLQWADGKKI
ncbi:MAG: Tellurium resistance protein TerA [Alphaproteobacteria bacterium]|jgi:tellurite resistance protein TerA|nr:Tellurium resistance protein TerA [Alphaproteobacteria bacterium]MDP7222251.1 Tellurium resistance protein TerA [Alphaproteobacteria bacterium]